MAKPAVAEFEVTGRDGAALRRFYPDLFDWEIQEGARGTGLGVVQHGAASAIRHRSRASLASASVDRTRPAVASSRNRGQRSRADR